MEGEEGYTVLDNSWVDSNEAIENIAKNVVNPYFVFFLELYKTNNK